MWRFQFHFKFVKFYLLQWQVRLKLKLKHLVDLDDLVEIVQRANYLLHPHPDFDPEAHPRPDARTYVLRGRSQVVCIL